ncbi:MAG TPA: outer membrane protein assembly factor BamE [Rhizorhapis sp.]|nr:outer membrane protein assembly factor BamE [Rhizorhapis sp.]HKX21877.1 outer membrane protein assembly factor BamE [Rhizorhapis sp.]
MLVFRENLMRLNIARFAMVAGALALLPLASGCARVRAHQGYIVDNLLVDSVQPGVDNKASVERTLGRPSFAGQFDSSEWYYVARDTRQLAFSKPKPVNQTVLRVRFDQAGNVVAVDKTGLDLVAKIDPESDKTPTLGRKRGLFQEIFGNIGAVGAAGTGSGSDSTGPGPNGS